MIGVFPYSAIDMGTYETLKGAYCRSTGQDEPPVYAVLSFGALSGSIGAASVYRELDVPTSGPSHANHGLQPTLACLRPHDLPTATIVAHEPR